MSGGIDSMYLANRAPELFPGARFAVAHCNFSLRGEESDGDEAFVRAWCAEHGMECFVTRFDTQGYADSRGISIEMAARDLRYGWFARTAKENGFDAVALAHNANDNAETLMLNLLRGTGSRGMRGMSADTVNAEGLRLLRPLLGTERAEIEAWMRAGGHSWREDSTNAQNEYKRNIIRNEVFPVFGKINPSSVQTLCADMERFTEADDIAEDYFLSVRDGVWDGSSIGVDALLALKHWKFVLWRLLEPCGLSWPTFGKMVALLTRFRECPRGTVTLGGKVFESPTHAVRISKGRIRPEKR